MKNLILMIAFFSLFAQSCGKKNTETKMNSEDIEFAFDGIEQRLVDSKNAEIDLSFKVKNNTTDAVSCTKVEVSPETNGASDVKVQKKSDTVDLKLNSGEEKILSVSVPVSLITVSYDPSSEDERPSFRTTLKGSLNCNGDKYGFEYGGEFTLPTHPLLGIGKIDISKARGGDMSFDVALRLSNNNPYELMVKDISASFDLEGTRISEQTFAPVRLPAASAIDLQLQLNEEELAKMLPKLKKLKEFNYSSMLSYKLSGDENPHGLSHEGKTSF